MWTMTRFGVTPAQLQRRSMDAFGASYLPDSMRVQSPKATKVVICEARQADARASRAASLKAQQVAVSERLNLSEKVNFCADLERGAWLDAFCPEYTRHADLDGTHAAHFLRSAGFEVVANGDNGRFGFARTACGIMLSTNGHIWRVEA